MSQFLKIFSIFSFFILFQSNLFGKIVSEDQFPSKIYVSYQDLRISDEGLFWILPDSSELPLKSIGVDEVGFFGIQMRENEIIQPKKDPECLNGHRILS